MGSLRSRLSGVCFCTLLLEVMFSVSAPAADDNVPRLLLISMDGFRWDYLQMMKKNKLETPYFDALIQDGCTIKTGGMKNVFPTKTKPNHYSIVTGLTAEQHGIVANKIYDPVAKKTLDTYKDSRDSFWYNNGTDPATGPEPIWVTNQKAPPIGDFKRQSGVYLFPGGEAEIHGMLPHKFVYYEVGMHQTGFRERVDRMLEWFECNTINLGLLYFNEPDHTGHRHGPNSEEVRQKILQMDAILGRLINGSKETGLWDRLNIILTSDHGMAEVYPNQTINLLDYVSEDSFEAYGQWTNLNIFPKKGREKEVLHNLSSVQHMTIYRKNETPAEYHYRYNVRIAPLVAVADLGWTMGTNFSDPTKKGDHGYNNSLPEMHPIFIARGPAFKQNCTVEQFSTTDIYPLMCQVLGITPADGQGGSLDIVKGMLKDKPPVPSSAPPARASSPSTPPDTTTRPPGTLEKVKDMLKQKRTAVAVAVIFGVALLAAICGVIYARRKGYCVKRRYTEVHHRRRFRKPILSDSSESEGEIEHFVGSDVRQLNRK